LQKILKENKPRVIMKEKKFKKIFVEGPIAASFISDSIQKHSTQKTIGGHSIFLGQVRADVIDEKTVALIEYTSYEEMALEKMHEIRESIFAKYDLSCMHVYHSLGKVAAGEISLFVFTSSSHRKEAIEACEETVEKIKAELPVWGKEIFADETHQWKEPSKSP
jgi:molybdopterin synthase catalytic subunit